MTRGPKPKILTERICTKCNVPKPIDEFYVRKKSGSTRSTVCKECSSIALKEYRKQTNYNYNRYWNNRDFERERHLIRKYGINFADYKIMLDKQNGVCAICGGPEPTEKLFDVDHSHNTGKVRGLLCTNCNRMLGYAKDNIETLINSVNYLKQYGN